MSWGSGRQRVGWQGCHRSPWRAPQTPCIGCCWESCKCRPPRYPFRSWWGSTWGGCRNQRRAGGRMHCPWTLSCAGWVSAGCKSRGAARWPRSCSAHCPVRASGLRCHSAWRRQTLWLGRSWHSCGRKGERGWDGGTAGPGVHRALLHPFVTFPTCIAQPQGNGSISDPSKCAYNPFYPENTFQITSSQVGELSSMLGLCAGMGLLFRHKLLQISNFEAIVVSGLKKVILPSAPLCWDPPGSPASSSGALSTGQSWSWWSGAGGGPSNDPRAGTPLLGGKAGSAGAAQPGEETAAGNHRITECSGLEGTSVCHPVQPPAEAGSPRAGCTGPCPGRSWISPEKETPQPPWAACSRALSPSEGRSSSSCSDRTSPASVCARCLHICVYGERGESLNTGVAAQPGPAEVIA